MEENTVSKKELIIFLRFLSSRRCDVRSATVDVRSATVDVRSATVDVRSATVDVRSATVDVSSDTVDRGSMRKARVRISIPKDDEDLVVRKGENTKIIINARRRSQEEKPDARVSTQKVEDYIHVEKENNSNVEENKYITKECRIADNQNEIIYHGNSELRISGLSQPVTIRVRPSVIPNKEKKYTITVHTGNVMYAGTNANVFVTLVGSKSTAANIALKKSLKHQDPFERGQVDIFHVEAGDLGAVYKIHIFHDNTGTFPGWYLNKVNIKDDETKQKFNFTLYDWLFKDHSHDSLRKTLEVDGTPIIAVSPSDEKDVEHHTEKFKVAKSCIVVRRGLTFKVDIHLAREYRPFHDKLMFALKTGKRPRENDKTLVLVEEILPKDFQTLINEATNWGFKIVKLDKDETVITTEIFIPPNALPGRYNIDIENDEGVLYIPKAQVYVLFNPWCKDDEVYMDNPDERNEYVLRQHGQIFRGNWKHPRPYDWYFGQFEGVCLDSVFNLLEDEPSKNRNSAVGISRIISSKTNSRDNSGILEGRWDGEYDDGRKPTSWNSTPAVLEYFQKNNCPVKYGQCWVFSAVVTTLMRGIGIPCRPVTNFSSAHDSNGNCSNDKYYGQDGEFLKEKTKDSVWNFHVWNDVWMARHDLPPGYGGWQAIDSTPQEISQGLFQMGPAPLAAVKTGELQHKYDTAFVLAEVNADTIYWQKNDEGKWEPVHRNFDMIGKRISTKAVGKRERHDITNEYKFEEGSVLERTAVRNALLKRSNVAVKPARKDIEMEIISEHEIMAGKDVEGTIKVQNKCNEERQLPLVWKAYIVRYDGVVIKELDKQKQELTLNGEKEENIALKVPASQFIEYLYDEVMIRIYATALVKGTKQLVVIDHLINIDFPRIEFTDLPTSTISSKNEFTFGVTLENPLEQPLTECEMYLDGTIIKDRMEFKDIKPIEGKGTFKHNITLTPAAVDNTKQWKKQSIVVTFSCKQLGGLGGVTSIDIID